MAKRALTCHGAQPSGAPQAMAGTVMLREDGSLGIQYDLRGKIGDLAIPDSAPGVHTDGLWQTTCFELFVGDGAGYREFNFSPSSAWAGYRFSGYREGMTTLDIPAPVIDLEQDEERLLLSVMLDRMALPSPPWKIGLSAVIEDMSGMKSYWALAHPPGTPDFHHPDCFVLLLEAGKGA